MPVNPALYCPIRGQLKIKAKTNDGLSFTEEKRRIDCIKYLLAKGYPKTHFRIESTLIQLGHGGHNSFRTDIVVYRIPAAKAEALDLEERRELIFLVAEIKRDHKEAEKAKKTQVKPALGFLPDMKSVGVYWDDVEQKVFYREIQGNKQVIQEAPITYLPNYDTPVKVKRLRYNDLDKATSLVSLFRKIENALHSYIADVE